ncbi:MAG TPA: hypothetical protein VFD58_26900 [Blastocatellia bacterium]|nr:hypothetical protein [Blastocatellia bacterium]
MSLAPSPGSLVSERFDAIFASLPPPGSPEYLDHLRQADAPTVPAQVLVRAFRQLKAAAQEEAAAATLARLMDENNQYLKVVRHLSKRQVPAGQNWHDADDLYQAAMVEIMKVLPTPRGVLAEVAWVRFCQNCFEDAWRSLHGRRGERLRIEFAEPTPDDESSELIFPVEQTTGETAPWHAGAKKSELPKIEKLIEKTIAGMKDPLMRRVAEDQFSDDPSPISSGRSTGGKPPLTEQLGASRFQISRALRNAKARLAGALLADSEHDVDVTWLRQFV